MVRDVFMSTNLQRALGLLAEHPDQSYFVKEVSRLAGISYGGASEALAYLSRIHRNQTAGPCLRYCLNDAANEATSLSRVLP